MKNHNFKILSKYFDNDNLFFQNVTYRSFFKDLLDASTDHHKENKGQESKILTVIYRENNIKMFLHDLFQTLVDGNIALIISHETPGSKKLLSDIKQQFDTSFKVRKNEYPAIILRTSGSSGIPKNVIFDLSSLFMSAQDTVDHYGLNEGDKWGCTLPLNHVGGLMILIRTLLLKSEFIPMSPSKMTNEDIGKVDYLSLVPTQLKKLIDSTFSLSNLKGIVLGGAKPQLDVIKEIISKDIRLASSYGMSETCAQIASTPFTKDLNILATSGSALGNSQITLTRGRIQICSERLALGYLDGTRFDNKFITQDLGQIDSDGNVVVKGRIDDVIISGGENINLFEVSDALNSYYPNSASTTLPIKDNHFGEVCFSIVNYRENATPLSERALKHALSKTIESFKIPKKIFYSINPTDDEQAFQLKVTKSEKDKLLSSIEKFNFLHQMKLNCLHMGNLNARPLFVFHGFMGSHTDFNFLLKEKDFLQNYHIILIDLPLHGYTPELKEFSTLTYFCQAFAAQIEKNKLDPTFIGYSLGGRIAYEISKTLKTPAKLILESSSIGIENIDEKRARASRDSRFMDAVKTKHEFRAELRKWYEMDIFRGLNQRQIEELVTSKEYELLSNYKEAAYFYSPSHQDFILPENIQYNHEFHFIYGELDDKYAQVSHNFDSSYSIKSASHNTHFMNKNRYLDILRSLLVK